VRILRASAIIVVLICCRLAVYAQNGTSEGTEFWTGYMDHIYPPDGARGAMMDLYITSAVSTTGKVTIADGSYTKNFTVTANQVTIITIPSSAFIGAQGTYNKGIHITSLKPIAIYAHIFAQDSSGATLLLPVAAMGKDYYSINYYQSANAVAYSAFMVIATRDSTTVEITPAANLLNGALAGTTFNITLNKGQLYQGLSANDLSGTRIRSIGSGANACTKIAVFSGSSKIAITCDTALKSSDNLFQQVYPTASWGKNYITIPLKNRNYDIFRIILSNAATSVKLNGAIVPPANFTNGFYHEFNSAKPNIITADQPIQVVQYAVTQGNTLTCKIDSTDVGDPEMIYLTPLEQTLDHVTLYSTQNFAILNSYINVIIKTAATKSFRIDSKPYTGFSVVPNNNLYAYAQIDVAPGTHNISAGDGFNAIAYGFGQFESYGYAAGANLQGLNTFLVLQNPLTHTYQNNGCAGVNYNLGLTIPYKTTKITWQFKDGTPVYVDNNPKVDSVLKGTQELYRYTYPKGPVNNKRGSYTVIATVFDPSPDVCSSSQDIEFDYNITDPPVAKFGVSNVCLGDSVLFTDQTTGGATLKSWAWNFGDGGTSTLQNPLHKYLNPAKYSVSLMVTDIDSCTAIYNLSNLQIDPRPVAQFTSSIPDCATHAITFTDQSTSAVAAIAKRIWNFGDGTTDTITNNATTLTHTYSIAGLDTVKLFVVTVNGCASPVFSQVEQIKPLPLADFSLPDVCLTDTYARFADKSTIADSTMSAFTYLWNFGDQNESSSNPNTSTLKNPAHKYKQATYYKVSLTVTSKYGCSATKTQPFTVNGANPVAGFSVENNGNLCSSDSVVFDDRSSVDFGNITKIIWYFDYNNNPTDSVVYTRGTMPANKRYRHSYGLFNTGGVKNFAIKMIAYSGQTCVSEYGPVTVTIKANPVINLSQLGNICLNSPPVQIVEKRNGYMGTGVFSGPGVSPVGLFNPAVSGIGNFTIHYIFTAQNGCNYSTSEQVTVVAPPTIKVDSVITLLEGAQVPLNATASGNGLAFKWTPVTGLNHDNILNPIASPLDDTQYTLAVTSADSCVVYANVFVKVLKKLIIPNTFTPNGDNINDYWEIKYLNQYPNCTVDIFNRYGQKLFTSIGYAQPWDGKYQGNYLPTGTYYYIINPKNGRSRVSGSVTIIR
jgi:gliding motility-associated-like protein